MRIENCKYISCSPIILDQIVVERAEENALFWWTAAHATTWMESTRKMTPHGLIAVKVSDRDQKKNYTAANFSLTEACDHCMILDIPFHGCMTAVYLPVVKPLKTDTFKSIGIFSLRYPISTKK